MNWKDSKSKQFIKAILAIKTDDEAMRFLRDLMTRKEIEEFGNRLRAAEMLMENMSYSTIVEETGLSSTTVARVAKWLNGRLGGYKIIIDRLHHHNSIQSRRELS